MEMVDPLEVLGFDPRDPGFLADPYPHYDRLRASGPYHRTQAGLLLVTGYRAGAAVLRDPRFGHGEQPLSGDEAGSPDGEGGVFPPRSFLTMDPPEHTRLRALVSRAFTARMVDRLRPRIAELAGELVERARVAGEVDLIAAVAYPLPIIVICELLGVPKSDQDRFKEWSAALTRGLDPDFLLSAEEVARRNKARQEFGAYFDELATARRADPGDDLLSALVRLEGQDGALTRPELLATCILLLVAGHETTVNLIANGMLALLRHPRQRAYLRADPEATPAAVEELLRYDPPVQLTARVALEPAEVAGRRFGRGEAVMVLVGATNRDAAVYPAPNRLDLTRDSRHLAFGLGVHFCLGAPLARLEGELALATLAAHDLELLDPDPPYKENLILRGLAELPVRLR